MLQHVTQKAPEYVMVLFFFSICTQLAVITSTYPGGVEGFTFNPPRHLLRNLPLHDKLYVSSLHSMLCCMLYAL
jgi:hypothetical protein